MGMLAELNRCAPWIEAALEYTGGTHTLDNVIAEIYSGKLQFWAGTNCAIVTEIEVYPQTKTLHFFLAGGDLAELREMTAKLEIWAKGIGCKAATLTGRKGWEKPLAGDGYTPKWFVLAKDLTNG
jgi:hypothetical protein